jgi:CheY-like chemotaxis protein
MKLEGLKVLLVEDELLIRELFEFTLAMHRAEVRTASKVSDAMQILNSWTPDVVITDIGLPETDGYDLIRFLRGTARTESLPIIALSGYVSNHEQKSTDPYLLKISKPVDPDYLIKMIVEQTQPKK